MHSEPFSKEEHPWSLLTIPEMAVAKEAPLLRVRISIILLFSGEFKNCPRPLWLRLIGKGEEVPLHPCFFHSSDHLCS